MRGDNTKMYKLLKITKAKNGISIRILKRKYFFFLISTETYVYNEDNPLTKELIKLASAKDE